MKVGIDTLSQRQFRCVVTAFEARMRKLKASGDYPEEFEDKVIHTVLINHLYDIKE